MYTGIETNNKTVSTLLVYKTFQNISGKMHGPLATQCRHCEKDYIPTGISVYYEIRIRDNLRLTISSG